jgi:DNA-binding XRE family transcriptional regulator
MTRTTCYFCGTVQFTPSSGKCAKCHRILFHIFEISLVTDAARADLPQEPAVALGAAILKIRHLHGQTQDRVASSAVVERSQLSRFECGKSAPRLRTVARILRALHVDAVVLRVKASPQGAK